MVLAVPVEIFYVDIPIPVAAKLLRAILQEEGVIAEA
jgi:hypothetical protein